MPIPPGFTGLVFYCTELAVPTRQRGVRDGRMSYSQALSPQLPGKLVVRVPVHTASASSSLPSVGVPR